MGLDEPDRVGCHPRIPIRDAEGPCLAFGRGRVDRLTLAVARRPDAFDDRVDAVAVPLGVRQPLECYDTYTFAENRPVRVLVERLCVPRRRKRGCLREAHVHEDVVKRVQAPAEHHVGPTRFELQGREMNGTQ